MTHTVHPYAHRIGTLRGWKSRWFRADKDVYKGYLKSDVLIREFLEKKLREHYISSIQMERNNNQLRVIIRTSRPGMIIGRSGDGIQQIKKALEKYSTRKKLAGTENIKIDVEEVRSAESDAKIVGRMIAEGIERRLPFRRVLKQTVEKVMANRDVEGVRIALSGRLGGAEMARKEGLKKGRVPLQTIRADIDFARVKARIPQGDVGIKVWIYRGERFDA
jgi:small subunit ribosomal protein S3